MVQRAGWQAPCAPCRKGPLEERQSYEKQLKNARAVNSKDTTIAAATAAEFSGGFSVEDGEERIVPAPAIYATPAHARDITPAPAAYSALAPGVNAARAPAEHAAPAHVAE